MNGFIFVHSFCFLSGLLRFVAGKSPRFESFRIIIDVLAGIFLYLPWITYSIFLCKKYEDVTEIDQKFILILNWLSRENTYFFAWIISSGIFIFCIYMSKFESVWRDRK